jgi:hypothetical protein
MTQDQPGQAQGTGYAARGEVVPDDETGVTQDDQSGSMTRFKKVASALRGDRPQQRVADPADEMTGPSSDEEYADPAGPDDVYSARWQQIQFRFVDDPQASVTEAAEVVSQVTGKLEAAIQERQRAIEERQRAIQERASALRGRWGEGSNADTETLRETLRMYRAFMDQLIGPTA